MTETTNDEIRDTVRQRYAATARSTETPRDCGCAPGCCGGGDGGTSLALGYSEEDLASVPDGADLGLGCGNPGAIAALKPGETVLDLGAGGGFDCFLAARAVGPEGRVIGVDMTPEMISRARAAARENGIGNVDFRLGEIEHLPVADGSVDVILSNCVVNLSPEKSAVFEEAFRVLRPGGRLAISDVVALGSIPEELAADWEAMTGCISGAASVEVLHELLLSTGFEQVQIAVNDKSREFIRDWMPGSRAEDYVASATIEAVKPGGNDCCAGAGSAS